LFKFAKGGGEFSSITSHGNASKMFTAFDKGIDWESPDRQGLIALATNYGQVVLPDDCFESVAARNNTAE
jgi:hypothetical protein